ncbi:hypothetical protein D3C84_1086110 [compost metagenome]
MNNAAPRDPFQDAAAKARRDDFAANFEKDVHTADFFEVLLFDGVEPKHLCAVMLFSQHLCLQASCVIAGNFRIACSALHRARIVAFHKDVNRLEPFLIVRINWRHNDNKGISHRWTDP